MKFALFAVLAVFSAPAPVAETPIGAEEEVLAEFSQNAKSASATARRLQGPAAPALPFLTPTPDPALPFRPTGVWSSRQFSRPPPAR